MKKKWIAVLGTGAMVIGLALAGASFANSHHTEIRNGTIRIDQQSEAQFPSMVKITMDEAVKKALTSVQGQILKTELEDEDGFLVYGVEVVTADSSIMEVKVDAGSGEVLAVERDKADGDGHENCKDEDRDDEE